MLNFFYWYAVIWGIVFFLYSLGLSTVCTPLDPVTRTFFLTTIIISIVLGFVLRKDFKYSELDIKPERSSYFTLLIIIMAIADCIYSNEIPLFDIISGKTAYGDFPGIPLIHTILVDSILFYSVYLFYLYLETKDRKILVETIIILLIPLLLFQKGLIIFSLFSLFNLGIAKAIKVYGKMKPKYIVLIILGIFLILYINGGLTNVRSGVGWNNESFPTSLCGLNNKWPRWLPVQFGWTYAYVVSPLANLNYNISTINNTNWPILLVSTTPDILAKRISPISYANSKRKLLITPVLNACTGFIESVRGGGRFGLWYYFIIFTLVMLLVFVVRCKGKKIYSSAYLSIICMMTVFNFFYNTLVESATALLPWFILLSPYLSKKKIVFTFNAQNRF